MFKEDFTKRLSLLMTSIFKVLTLLIILSINIFHSFSAYGAAEEVNASGSKRASVSNGEDGTRPLKRARHQQDSHTEDDDLIKELSSNRRPLYSNDGGFPGFYLINAINEIPEAQVEEFIEHFRKIGNCLEGNCHRRFVIIENLLKFKPELRKKILKFLQPLIFEDHICINDEIFEFFHLEGWEPIAKYAIQFGFKYTDDDQYGNVLYALRYLLQGEEESTVNNRLSSLRTFAEEKELDGFSFSRFISSLGSFDRQYFGFLFEYISRNYNWIKDGHAAAEMLSIVSDQEDNWREILIYVELPCIRERCPRERDWQWIITAIKAALPFLSPDHEKNSNEILKLIIELYPFAFESFQPHDVSITDYTEDKVYNCANRLIKKMKDNKEPVSIGMIEHIFKFLVSHQDEIFKYNEDIGDFDRLPITEIEKLVKRVWGRRI